MQKRAILGKAYDKLDASNMSLPIVINILKTHSQRNDDKQEAPFGGLYKPALFI